MGPHYVIGRTTRQRLILTRTNNPRFPLNDRHIRTEPALCVGSGRDYHVFHLSLAFQRCVQGSAAETVLEIKGHNRCYSVCSDGERYPGVLEGFIERGTCLLLWRSICSICRELCDQRSSYGMCPCSVFRPDELTITAILIGPCHERDCPRRRSHRCVCNIQNTHCLLIGD